MKKLLFIFFILFNIGFSKAQFAERVLLVVDQQNQPLVNFEVTLQFLDPLGKALHSQLSLTDNDGQITTTSALPISVIIDPELGKIENARIAPWLNTEKELKIQVTTEINRINPVSITGSLSPRLATQNPYAVEVISQKTIALMGAQNLTDVLQNQSNIQLSQDPVLGSSIQLQGLGGQNVKILVNSVPMIGRTNGNLDISQIPMNNVERIEIIEGPMSAVYGSDAIGGVVNIITKKPISNLNRVQTNSYIDGVGNTNIDANFQLGNLSRKSRIGLVCDMGRQFFGGTDFDPSTRSADWKPKTKLFGSIGLNYQLKKSNHLLRYSAFHEKITDRSDAEYNLTTVTGYNNYFNTYRNDFLSLSDFTLNKRNKLQFQNSFNIYERTKTMVRRNLVEGTETLTRGEDQDTTVNYQANFRGFWSHQSANKKLDWLTGYEGQYESLQTKRVLKKDGIFDMGVFSTVDINLSPKVQIKPSVRFVYNNQFGTNPLPGVLGNNFKIAPIIPSLQLKFNATKHLILRGSYARGFRAPSIKELYFLFVDINHNVQGNPMLTTETAHNFIASVDYRHNINKISAVTFKLSYFKNYVTNQIQLALVDSRSNLYQYINIGKMNSQGINSQIEYFYNQLQIKLSSSWINNQSLSDQGNSWRNWNVIQSGLNLMYTIQKPKVSLQLFSRYTGKNYGYEESGKAFEIDPYFIADMSLSVPLLKDHIVIQTGCKNIFGVTQVLSSASTGSVHNNGNGNLNVANGRNVFLSVKINL